MATPITSPQVAADYTIAPLRARDRRRRRQADRKVGGSVEAVRCQAGADVGGGCVRVQGHGSTICQDAVWVGRADGVRDGPRGRARRLSAGMNWWLAITISRARSSPRTRCTPKQRPPARSSRLAASASSWSRATSPACVRAWRRSSGAFPPSVRTIDKGHGRLETRTIQTLHVPNGLGFPYVEQAWRIERITERPKSVIDPHTHLRVTESTTTREVAYAIASLYSEQAGPEQLLAFIRGHWSIEAMHHIEDVAFDADNSRIRIRHGPANMTTLTRLAVAIIRHLGFRAVPSGQRHLANDRNNLICRRTTRSVLLPRANPGIRTRPPAHGPSRPPPVAPAPAANTGPPVANRSCHHSPPKPHSAPPNLAVTLTAAGP